MKLNIQKRNTEKGGNLNALRREGFIPAVFYSKSRQSENVTVSKAEFDAFMRELTPGRLSTTKITLIGEDGKERQAIIKDIQYEVTTYNVIHLDFEELVPSTKVRVNVPIECVGMAECPGIKLGGVLRQVIRTLRIECLPKDMPEFFNLNVASLDMRQSLRLRDIVLTEGLRAIADLYEVVAVIVKR
jgi:large subunit ribosomal protein L25